MNICSIFENNCSLKTHFIIKILFSIVLSITLYVYVSKLKFSFSVKDIPWNRFLDTSLSFSSKFSQNEKIDCNRLTKYCKSNIDCVNGCETLGYECINQQCHRPIKIVEKVKNCNPKNGGISVIENGEHSCLCTKPLFYYGEECDKKNPTLIGDIDPSFDGLVNETTPEFVKCKENLVAFKIGESIECIDPYLINILNLIYEKI